jgi:hypothetical protein
MRAPQKGEEAYLAYALHGPPEYSSLQMQIDDATVGTSIKANPTLCFCYCYCYCYLGTFKAYLCQGVLRLDLLSSTNTIYPSHLLSIGKVAL